MDIMGDIMKKCIYLKLLFCLTGTIVHSMESGARNVVLDPTSEINLVEYAQRRSVREGYFPGQVDIRLEYLRKQDGAAVGSAEEYEAKFIWRLLISSNYGGIGVLRIDKKAFMSAETLRNNGIMIPEEQ